MAHPEGHSVCTVELSGSIELHIELPVAMRINSAGPFNAIIHECNVAPPGSKSCWNYAHTWSPFGQAACHPLWGVTPPGSWHTACISRNHANSWHTYGNSKPHANLMAQALHQQYPYQQLARKLPT